MTRGPVGSAGGVAFDMGCWARTGSAFLLAAVALLLLATVPPSRASETLLLFCARALITGAFLVIWVYTPEIYPTAYRTTASGLANSFARFGGMRVPRLCRRRAPFELAPSHASRQNADVATGSDGCLEKLTWPRVTPNRCDGCLEKLTWPRVTPNLVTAPLSVANISRSSCGGHTHSTPKLDDATEPDIHGSNPLLHLQASALRWPGLAIARPRCCGQVDLCRVLRGRLVGLGDASDGDSGRTAPRGGGGG